ncbi:MAG: hypothetical protein JJLCMIEE_00198 [Acidimicrobiales bacterium]|nr:MAG: hypothetical protein EDR02_01260 [Actinomycetota bacterium]MBV6507158.1 hypothetical protein [Acidimicrobiales bacterium]RIK05547.1 MAG: hypothetical protein DCC48_09665 [Acidobacteriota bacterium]
MPWCEPCSKFYNPNTLAEDGTCPRCGTRVAQQASPVPRGGAAGQRQTGEPGAPPKAPWHFWLMIAAVAIYLGWRLVQGIAALVT